MKKIELTVHNPIAALAMALGGLIPFSGLALLCYGLRDPEGFRRLWPVIAVIALGCAGALVAVGVGIRFMLRGKCEIEYDEAMVRVRTVGLRTSKWRSFAWGDITKIGFFPSRKVGTRGFVGIVSPRESYAFGGGTGL